MREPAPNLDRDDIRGVTRPLVAGIGIEDLVCPRRRKNGTADGEKLVHLGLRSTIERTDG